MIFISSLILLGFGVLSLIAFFASVVIDMTGVWKIPDDGFIILIWISQACFFMGVVLLVTSLLSAAVTG